MQSSDESRSGNCPVSGASDGTPTDKMSARIADLVERTEEEVFRFISQRVRNEATALELTQETFLQVWRARDQFDPAQDGRSLVFEIARNVVISDHRAATSQKRGGGKTTSLELLSLVIDRQGQSRPSTNVFATDSEHPLDGLIRTESLEAMDRAAESLRQNDRDLYALLRAGRSAAEIATMTGRTVAAVASHQTRLLHKMRREMSPPPSKKE